MTHEASFRAEFTKGELLAFMEERRIRRKALVQDTVVAIIGACKVDEATSKALYPGVLTLIERLVDKVTE